MRQRETCSRYRYVDDEDDDEEVDVDVSGLFVRDFGFVTGSRMIRARSSETT